MQLSNQQVNIFVFGDLVLDHVILVGKKEREYQSIGSEKIYEVRRRISSAGGAANCARVLASLGAGRVSLWGLTGHSAWGMYPQIISIGHTFDGSHTSVVFHGIHDEAKQMNTITRIITIDDSGRQYHEARFDDITYARATDSDVAIALNHLKNEYQDFGLDAIILNDLDMNALTPDLIKEVAEFAEEKEIPLFVDPKRAWEKYKFVRATCVLPNLKEWCNICNQQGRDEFWRHNLNNPEELKRMAVRTLRYMPNIDHCVIKCDKDGAVVIITNKRSTHSIYHIKPHPTVEKDLPHQIGTGDVLTAVLALEYASEKGTQGPMGPNNSERLLEAFHVANWVVAAYRQMTWHRMPNRIEVERLTTKPPGIQRETTIRSGILHLPPPEHLIISLEEVSTEVAGLISVDPDFKAAIHNLLVFLERDWDKTNPRSAILTARGGSGKTELTRALTQLLEKHSVQVFDFTEIARRSIDIKQAGDEIFKIWSNLPATTAGLLLIIDEAFSSTGHLLLADQGKVLLQLMNDPGRCTRFLFVDADFERYKERLSTSQFINRCNVYELPPIGRRIWDVPYIFASGCLKVLRKERHELNIKISEAVLLAIINWVLATPERDQSARTIVKEAEEMVAQIIASDYSPPLTLSARHLRQNRVLKDHFLSPESEKRIFEFRSYT
jgi:sugar/nucleoside kinase (ribokinase family)